MTSFYAITLASTDILNSKFSTMSQEALAEQSIEQPAAVVESAVSNPTDTNPPQR